ncbi:MAG: LacI family transcriptional regulator [Lachnospiraceae bacterium]|jgi:DNA-binding LacI/PurR family transcriptional regulator|nr:LacI family transcriptional regulator [Lachnospiraceae bacterium]
MEYQKNKVTSVDVAKLAGVSQTTVSRAFNKPDSVNNDTLEKIRNAARQLNYTPSILAQSLVLHQTNLIGVIVNGLENPFYASFVSQISRKLHAIGKKILLFSSFDERSIYEVLQEANSFHVSGLIIASATLSEQLTEKNIPTRIPVVMINRQTSSKNYCSVASDDIESSRFAADFFISRNFHSFAFISGPDSMTSSVQRQQGFLNRLAEWGYYHIPVAKGDYTYPSGYRAMQELLLAQPTLPMAILCANDLMALGAMDAIKDHSSYRIPEDFALIGYDDIIESNWKSYQLSSIRLPIDQMINTAFEYLNSYFTSPGTLSGKHLFPCTFVERKTT